MRYTNWTALLIILISSPLFGTPPEAFIEGREFAETGMTAAGDAVNDTTASENLPFYSTTAPETAHFNNGQELIGGAGTAKQTECETHTAINEYQQQECDAVNFLSRNSTERPRFTIEPNTDPIIVGSDNIISNPGYIPGTSTNECHVQTIVTPGTYVVEHCTESYWLDTHTCTRTLEVTCDEEQNPPPEDCTNRGIIPDNISATGDNHSYAFDGSNLSLINLNTDPYSQTIGNYSFEIEGIDQFTQFLIGSIHSDNWVGVQVNGAYIGTHSRYLGGFDSSSDQLRIEQSMVRYSLTAPLAEMETGGNLQSSASINLLPYLREGGNNITLYVINGGGRGYGAVNIHTRHECSDTCTDQLENNQCTEYESRIHTCRRINSICTATNETRDINGNPTFRECWRYTDTYECRSDSTTTDCQTLRDEGCTQLGSSCVEYDYANMCIMHEQSYRCPLEPEVVTQSTVCEDVAFCQDDGMGCFDTSSPADQDFGTAVSVSEAARQAGVYGIDLGDIDFFKGYRESCTVKVLGNNNIKSCCKSLGGGGNFTNNILMGAGMTIMSEAAGETARIGSQYVYDALYHQIDSTIVQEGLDAMNSWTSTLGDGAFNPSLDIYGFSFEFSLANGIEFTGFDPYTFAISIAVMVVTEWLECETNEQVLGMKRGQNLCTYQRSYCSEEILNTCIEKTQVYCCFNSKLAKIVNRQGRQQLGLTLNACDGFDQAQLESLDFSAMDFSEFIADIMPAEADIPAMTEQVRSSVEQQIQEYYNQ